MITHNAYLNKEDIYGYEYTKNELESNRTIQGIFEKLNGLLKKGGALVCTNRAHRSSNNIISCYGGDIIYYLFDSKWLIEGNTITYKSKMFYA